MFLGVDIGSSMTKVVLLDENAVLVGYRLAPTGGNAKMAAQNAVKELLDSLHIAPGKILFSVSTGYGRKSVDFADRVVSEITCLAKEAYFHFPEVGTVIDIGGQDTKVVRVDSGGGVADFAMNDKCAAGTGRFLDTMARALELDLEDLSDIASKYQREVEISSVCTVFAESEVISLIAQGYSVADVVNAVHKSICHRVSGLAKRLGIRGSVVFSGGVAKSREMARHLELDLGYPVLRSAEPQISCALGAALIATGLNQSCPSVRK